MQPSPYIARGRSQTFSIYVLVMLSPPDVYSLFLPLLLDFPALVLKFPEPDVALANRTEQFDPSVATCFRISAHANVYSTEKRVPSW